MVAWIIRVVRVLFVLTSRHRALALENLAYASSWRSIGARDRTPPCVWLLREDSDPLAASDSETPRAPEDSNLQPSG